MPRITQAIFDTADDFVVLRYSFEQVSTVNWLQSKVCAILPENIELYEYMVEGRSFPPELLLCKGMRKTTIADFQQRDEEELRRTLCAFFTPVSGPADDVFDYKECVGTATLNTLPLELAAPQPILLLLTLPRCPQCVLTKPLLRELARVIRVRTYDLSINDFPRDGTLSVHREVPSLYVKLPKSDVFSRIENDNPQGWLQDSQLAELIGSAVLEGLGKAWEIYCDAWQRYLEARVAFHSLSALEREIDDSWVWGPLAEHCHDRALVEEARRTEMLAEATLRLEWARDELLRDTKYLRGRLADPEKIPTAISPAPTSCSD